MEEICTKDRLAAFMTPALLISDDRLLVQVIKTPARTDCQHAIGWLRRSRVHKGE